VKNGTHISGFIVNNVVFIRSFWLKKLKRCDLLSDTLHFLHMQGI